MERDAIITDENEPQAVSIPSRTTLRYDGR
jgi:hypothetical protein